MARRAPNLNLMREGMDALMERLGPAGTVRFIAMLGGRGDGVKEIRKMRDRETATMEELVERIRAREKRRGVRA